ncbi:MAG: hypothetical protein DMF91_09380, partial [Acidobacteria bacterium]
MRGRSRFAASAVVGGLVLLCTSVVVRAQAPLRPIGNIAAAATGAIQGIVLDERGKPVNGAVVSAFGATPAFATTDRTGRFELRPLSPGPYVVRAHSSGFIASRGQIVDVRPSSRASSSIALRRVTPEPYPVLAAGSAVPVSLPEPAQPGGDSASTGDTDDHSETAWRLRHARRGVLKDATMPAAILAEETPDTNIFAQHAIYRAGQPPDDRFVRYAAAVLHHRQLLARRGVHDGQRPRGIGRLDHARRAHAGRHRVVDHRRLVHHTVAGAASLRHRHVVRDAALRRWQPGGAARCDRWQPQRGRDARLRHLCDQPSRLADVRQSVRALRLSGESRAVQPARIVDADPRGARPDQHARVVARGRAGRRGVPPAERQRHLATAAAHVLVDHGRSAPQGGEDDARGDGSRARFGVRVDSVISRL